jgi:limonene-1,2-epoxide hydrolase
MTAESSLEENKRIVRAFIDAAFNQLTPDRVAEYMTADIRWHGGTLGTVEGRFELLTKGVDNGRWIDAPSLTTRRLTTRSDRC